MPREITNVPGHIAVAPDRAPRTGIESRQAWLRLLAALALGTVGGAGMWAIVVVLPAVQSEFAITRGQISGAYTLTMLGFGIGGVAMGRLADRFGILAPVLAGIAMLAVGYAAAALSPSFWPFALAQGLLIGFGTGAYFSPLIAEISLWFTRRRGLAVAICASGNYLAGTIWPPIVSHFTATIGWRHTYMALGAICVVTMLPLALALRGRAVSESGASPSAVPAGALSLSPALLQTLLIVAGLACCVAMSMPQVHIVAYCGDLGYGVARGAEMLSLMLGFGIVSRLASGFVADRLGGLPTLLLGSLLQAVALVLYLLFDGLASLYVISALFGLFQGGIVPSYAIIIRENFPPEEAGTRVGIVIMATLVGMALGGWMSGVVFDLTGSYRAAFANGILWNLLNLAIAASLVFRRRPVAALAA